MSAAPETTPAGETTAVTLAALTDEVQAWMDALETVEADLAEGDIMRKEELSLAKQDIEQKLLAFAAALIQKVDNTAEFLNRLEFESDYAKAEKQRMDRRQKHFERFHDWLKQYVIGVMEERHVKQLKGQRWTMSLRKCPDSVNVTDEPAVPLEFKEAVVSMPATLWIQLMEALEPDFQAQVIRALSKQDLTIRKADLKKALQRGDGEGFVYDAAGQATMPGAELVTDKNTLRLS